MERIEAQRADTLKHRSGSEPVQNGICGIDYIEAGSESWDTVDGCVIEESPLTLYVNGVEWVTLMCTPVNQDELAIGFMLSEGVITSLQEVVVLDISHRGRVADIWLAHKVALPNRRVVTSGCVGGVTFTEGSNVAPCPYPGPDVTPAQLLALMHQLRQAAVLYPQSRGVHTSALSDGQQLLIVREDVGRHNTLDKLHGACVKQGINPSNGVLLTTGRISSEMLHKAASMQSPIVVSRTSPTSMALELALKWNITVVGYACGDRLRIYLDPTDRVCLPVPVQLPAVFAPYAPCMSEAGSRNKSGGRLI